MLLKAGNDLLEDREGAAGNEEIQEEIASVRNRMEFIVVASNERQKELESTWSTVKNLDESVQSLTVQIKQRHLEIEALLREDDPKNLSRRVKALNHEISSLKYQVANTNESGQEVIRYLEDTNQDTSNVVHKVTGVNNQWDQLQTQLLELRNRFDVKDIEDEIADRAPIIENFTKVSEVLVQTAQPGDKEELSREVNHVTQALSSIVDRAADRRRSLENIAPLADDFHDALQNLSEVISKVEDKLNIQRAFGAEPEKIQEEIEKIKRVQRLFPYLCPIRFQGPMYGY